MNTTLPNGAHWYRPMTAAALALSTALALVACDDGEREGQDPASSPTATDDALEPGGRWTPAELQALADDAVASGVPGIVVRVDDGEESYSVTASADWAGPVSADDTFRAGSNSKTATAVLALQLVDAGALDLDAPLSTWFADLPDGDTMTVRMLLNHTSGLADYVYDPESLLAMAGLRDELPTEEELIDMGVNATPDADLADGYNYSNAGYLMLGQIVADITGSSVPDRFETNIAAPLGLTETWFASPGRNPDPEMRGYEPDAEALAPMLPEGMPEGFGFAGEAAGEGWVEVTAIDQSWGGAAGAVISTPVEWAAFQQALLSGELISEELLGQMRETVPEDDTSGPGRSYGLGLEMVETSCGVVWGHDGALPGYRTDTYVDELGERSMTVVAATHFALALQPEVGAAHEELVDAVACAMFGSPSPASAE